MKIAPDAVPDDGWLDVCLVRAISRFELARQLPNVMQGLHVTHPAVEMLRVRSLMIETERPAALWIDGEVTGTTPARFTLEPASLPMLLPKKIAP
jgi:diacylglycerol kinase (ATP)